MKKVNEKEVKESDDYNYKGWITSQSFIKRCFGIYVHWLVAHLIITIPLVVLFLILGIIIGSSTINYYY